MEASPIGLELDWETREAASATAWDGLLARAGKSGLEQSWAYGEAMLALSRRRVRRGVLSDGAGPVAAVQAFERRVRGLGTLVQITRGPVWLRPEITPAEIAAGMALIRESWRIARREIVLWMPELPNDAQSHTVMRELGARRMITGYSSAWVDLRRDEDALRAALKGKWRNMLKAAEASRLRVEISHGGGALDWLLGEYQPFRRKARFLGPDARLIDALARAAPRNSRPMILRAYERRQPVAGVLMLRHGNAATYSIGWTGPDGRVRRAHHLLLWRAMLTMKQAGVEWFDVGGLFAASEPGVARFKLGLGGAVFTLAGTYL
jgi:Acetyltransferase (GNAT) domain